MTAQAVRCIAQSLSALGCFSESLKRGCRWYTATTTVLMQVRYRRFTILTSRNRGRFSAPVSSPMSTQIGQNAPADRGTLVQHFAHCWQQVAGCEQMAASLAGNSWKSARSHAIAGSERRVTTALRTGSDAAQSQRISRISLRSTSLAPARLTAWEHPTASA